MRTQTNGQEINPTAYSLDFGDYGKCPWTLSLNTLRFYNENWYMKLNRQNYEVVKRT